MPRFNHAPAKDMLRTMCVSMFGKEITVEISFSSKHLVYKVQQLFTDEKAFVPWKIVRDNNTQAIEKALRIWIN